MRSPEELRELVEDELGRLPFADGARRARRGPPLLAPRRRQAHRPGALPGDGRGARSRPGRGASGRVLARARAHVQPGPRRSARARRRRPAARAAERARALRRGRGHPRGRRAPHRGVSPRAPLPEPGVGARARRRDARHDRRPVRGRDHERRPRRRGARPPARAEDGTAAAGVCHVRGRRGRLPPASGRPGPRSERRSASSSRSSTTSSTRPVPPRSSGRRPGRTRRPGRSLTSRSTGSSGRASWRTRRGRASNGAWPRCRRTRPFSPSSSTRSGNGAPKLRRLRPGRRYAPSMKKRLDVLLVERGLAETRSQAQALVLAGRVPGFTKAGEQVDEAAELAVEPGPRFVSRGGEKLAQRARALRDRRHGRGLPRRRRLDRGLHRLPAAGRRGARLRARRRIRAAAPSFAPDPRVTVLERTNVRNLDCDELPFAPDLPHLRRLVHLAGEGTPPALACAAPGWRALVLVKPQFEAGRAEVGKGGVVRDPEVRQRVVDEVTAQVRDWGGRRRRRRRFRPARAEGKPRVLPLSRRRRASVSEPCVARAAVVTHGRPGAVGDAASLVGAGAPPRQASSCVEPARMMPMSWSRSAATGRCCGLSVPRSAAARRSSASTSGASGFLTSAEGDELETALAARLRRRLRVVELCTLAAELAGEPQIAVNDVVATSAEPGRMVELGWEIGGEELGPSPATG